MSCLNVLTHFAKTLLCIVNFPFTEVRSTHCSQFVFSSWQVVGTLFFILASLLYQAPAELPQGSSESTNQGTSDMSELTIKALPEDGVVIQHTRL